MCSADIFLGLLAVLFPPLPVWVKCGLCSVDSLINILLCVLGYIPGLLHAWYIIAKFPEPPCVYEAVHGNQEDGRVRYVYVQTSHGSNCQQPKSQEPRRGMNYGTNSSPHRQSPQIQQQGATNSGEGGSNNDHEGVPPPYAEVVASDHKIQTRD